MTIYDINNFKQQFLDFDFDYILIESNNEYINSNEHYLDFKNEYINNTNVHFEKLTELLKRFNILHNFYSKSSNNKYVYHYFDTNTKEDYNINIKNIIIDQRKLYSNFINHIDFLNNIKNSNHSINKEPENLEDKSRMVKVSNSNRKMKIV